MRITFSVVLVTAFLAGVVPVIGGHDDPPPPYTGDQQPANPQTTKGSSFWSTLRSPFVDGSVDDGDEGVADEGPHMSLKRDTPIFLPSSDVLIAFLLLSTVHELLHQ
ncbi:hypothetical protein C8R42DRAFT_728116 [Lentinula raphanica]|nr:hypothetical protein C8R42DRAFT_728116 [Lentinula raphanica]